MGLLTRRYVIGSQRPVQETCERVIRTSTRLMWTSSPMTCTWSSKRNGWVKQDTLPLMLRNDESMAKLMTPVREEMAFTGKVAEPFVTSHSADHC
ncbi:hypothetical protein [Hydrogenophaga taeniospiralis]|uniref:hypothetical protein n=1 Tax=Hydrogenophaga taeniospiralis TaxID=65656 RepID=UPI001CFA5ECD|nr:hypothetical protein [Hydrogenophaga taeniospiralis]UCU96338.1 hypothetical protein KI616_11120 [Hydrogenophaga taeniospiralis]